MSTSGPVAGWYRDPSQRHEHRFWNGSAWTPHVMTERHRALDYGEEPEPKASSPRVHWPLAVWALVLGGAGLVLVGGALPWAEAESATASVSRDGIDGNGAITIVTAVLLALAFVVVRRPRAAAGLVVVLALILVAVGIHDAVDTSRRAADLVAEGPPVLSANVGVGLWLTVAGAAIALIGGFVAFAVASRS